jgi:peptidoglycan/LPS O-acetylase OafA/YrhL
MVRLGHRPALDALRALAIVAVIAYHAYPDAAPGGYVGVEVFFVLSGFLITRLLLDERAATGTIGLRSFYARRARRLLPAVAVLALAYAAAAIVVGLPRAWMSILSVGLYFSNWLNAGGTPLASGLSQMWSLAIEEQFYLLWPILLVALVRLPRERVIRILLTMTLLAFAWREVMWRAGASANRVYYGSDTRCSALLLGCLVAWLTVNGPPAWMRHLTVPALAALGWLVLFPPTWHHVSPGMTLTLAALCTGVLLASGLHLPGYGLASIGQRAYGLYLWHPPLLAVAGALPAFTGRTELALVACVAVAEVSYRFVEQPLRRAGRKRIEQPAPQIARCLPSQ